MFKGYVTEVYSDRYFQGAVAQGGNSIVGAIGAAPDGYCWYVERVTCFSNTSQGTPVLELYVLRSNPPAASALDGSKAGREDVFAATAAGPDNPKNGCHDYRSPIYVGPGYFLVAVWTGVTAADLVALSTQIRVHKLTAGEHGPQRQLPPLHDERVAHAVVVGDEISAV